MRLVVEDDERSGGAALVGLLVGATCVSVRVECCLFIAVCRFQRAALVLKLLQVTSRSGPTPPCVCYTFTSSVTNNLFF